MTIDLSKLKAGDVVRVKLESTDAEYLGSEQAITMLPRQILSIEPAPVEKTEVEKWNGKWFQDSTAGEHYTEFAAAIIADVKKELGK